MESKKVQAKCPHCKKMFETVQSRVDRSEKHYCSVTCYGKARQKRIVRECPICLKKFPVQESKIRTGAYVFCSTACSKAFKSPTISEEKFLRALRAKKRAQEEAQRAKLKGKK